VSRDTPTTRVSIYTLAEDFRRFSAICDETVAPGRQRQRRQAATGRRDRPRAAGREAEHGMSQVRSMLATPPVARGDKREGGVKGDQGQPARTQSGASQPASQSVSEPASQPERERASQPASQSVSEPASQPERERASRSRALFGDPIVSRSGPRDQAPRAGARSPAIA
jgi:hypothetical protein